MSTTKDNPVCEWVRVRLPCGRVVTARTIRATTGATSAAGVAFTGRTTLMAAAAGGCFLLLLASFLD